MEKERKEDQVILDVDEDIGMMDELENLSNEGSEDCVQRDSFFFTGDR